MQLLAPALLMAGAAENQEPKPQASVERTEPYGARVVRALSPARTNDTAPSYTFEGRPVAIVVNERIANGSAFKTNLLAAMHERQLLDQVVWQWSAFDIPSNRWELSIGLRVPAPIIRCVAKSLLTLTNDRFSVSVPDESLPPWREQAIFIGERPSQNPNTLSRSWLITLLATNVSDSAFRIRMLGSPAILQSPAQANALAAPATGPVSRGMALVPAGPFEMGNVFPVGEVISEPPPGAVQIGSNRDQLLATSPEHPVHTVQVGAFYMDKFEVTRELFDEVRRWGREHGYLLRLPDSPTQAKGPNHPVYNVEWCDALIWCNARSEKDGLTPVYYTNATHQGVYRAGQVDLSNGDVLWTANGYRLPTEAEWEKAARGGLAGKRYSKANYLSHVVANYKAQPGVINFDASDTTGFHPLWHMGKPPFTSVVGWFSPNPYGIYDLLGNVQEWCWDRYDQNWYRNPACTQPDCAGPDTGASRVRRGGSYQSSAYDCRVASRTSQPPGTKTGDCGFRCVRRP
jgi:formylglycine-generating enzyme required for sulfatase activity